MFLGEVHNMNGVTVEKFIKILQNVDQQLPVYTSAESEMPLKLEAVAVEHVEGGKLALIIMA